MNEIKLRKEFQKAGIEIPFRLYDSLDSTNAAAKTFRPPCAVIARAQTAGKGRGGKSFASPRGGLYFSLALDGGSFPDIAVIPLICGIAVTGRIEGARLKWPNDVYLGGGGQPEKYYKIAGILCESSGGKLIIGAGLNVNTGSFPEDLKEKASSLALLRGAEYDMEETAASVISAILQNLRDGRYFSGETYLTARFAEYDLLDGRKVTVRIGEETFQGTASGIDGCGRLKVLCGGVTRLINCGEVSLLKNV